MFANCGFSTKMKSRFPTAAFTMMTGKKIFFNDVAPTWHQRGQFEHKFKKMVRCYNFFQKWDILTQNSFILALYH